MAPPTKNEQTPEEKKQALIESEINTVNKVIADITTRPSNNIIKPKSMNSIKMEDIVSVITSISLSLGLYRNEALEAIFLLFLLGASNKNTPNSLAVTVKDVEGIDVRVTKNDLLYHYKKVTGNLYLRRMAIHMADSISKFAVINKLEGDLSKQINRSLQAEGQYLTQIEQAWCSSFNQGNPTLTTIEELKRLPGLLAKDYIKKFAKSKGKPADFEEPLSPEENTQVSKGKTKEKLLIEKLRLELRNLKAKKNNNNQGTEANKSKGKNINKNNNNQSNNRIEKV
jgi:hypothetical protein